MQRVFVSLSLGLCILVGVIQAQAPPRLVPFAALVLDAAGQPRTGVVGLRFALYDSPEGGTPLWVEQQAVELDPQGRYQVVLGVTTDGVPADIFSTGAARWLAVQVDSGPEQRRVQLLAVPYAVAAAEAATLGGKTAEEFALADALRETVRDEVETQTETLRAGDPGVVTNATVNHIPKFTSSGGAIDDSAMTDAGGNIGVGTMTPNYLMQLYSAPSHSLLQVTNATTGATAGDGSYLGVQAGEQTLRVTNQENAPIEFYTNGTRRLTITTRGNVEINAANSNTGVGVSALDSVTSGSENTALGSYAVGYLTVGFENTGVGALALSNAVAGRSNTALGANSLAVG